MRSNCLMIFTIKSNGNFSKTFNSLMMNAKFESLEMGTEVKMEKENIVWSRNFELLTVSRSVIGAGPLIRY